MNVVDTITKDYRTSLLFGLISILMGITSFYLAHDQRHPSLIFAIGGVFVIGGIVLIAKSWWRLRDFRKLIAEGVKQVVWISVHNTGSGDSSATSFFVKVYPSKEESKASIVFEVNENRNLRELMESKEKGHATLLKREGNAGMVVIYVNDQMILPSSEVRYLKHTNAQVKQQH